jgi:hypothetical protein
MTTPHQEFLRRAGSARQLPLSGLHHHVMDRVFSSFDGAFSFEELLQKTVEDPVIMEHPSIAGNAGRAQLIAIRVIEGLMKTGMLGKAEPGVKRYVGLWSSDP